MSIYTKTGDSGFTSLYNGERVEKDEEIIELLGNLDEVTSQLGLARSLGKDNAINKLIEDIQSQLIDFMGLVAGKGDQTFLTSKTLEFEKLIDEYSSKYPKINKFVKPGNCIASATLDVARTVVRRSERALVRVGKKRKLDIELKVYLNRLSDLIYTLARYTEFYNVIDEKIKEIISENTLAHKSQVPLLTLQTSLNLIDRIKQRANILGIPVVVAVSSDSGNIIAVEAMDGALPASFDIAVNKAFTSATVRISTEELSKLSQPNGPLYGIQNTNKGRIIVFGGGNTLTYKGKHYGGVGVSGGTAEEDTLLCKEASHIFEEVMKCQFQ